MRKSVAAISPEAYVDALDGWQRARVEALRATVRAVAGLDEVVKWRNPVYLANGPAIVIRAEATRVLFGFWRGRRLRDLEPRLKPGGRYEMATLELREDTTIDPVVVRRLVETAVALDASLGDPTADVGTRRGASNTSTIRTACHCGAVSIAIPRAPDTLTNCDCSVCRRYGTLWAYYRQHEIVVDGPTASYARGPKTLRFVRCAQCGCVTHWEPTSDLRDDRVGVNARLFAPEQLGTPRIRRLDGAVTERYLDD